MIMEWVQNRYDPGAGLRWLCGNGSQGQARIPSTYLSRHPSQNLGDDTPFMQSIVAD
jgi:hypothetical protein